MAAARLAVGIDFGSSKTVVSFQESSSAHLSPHRLWLHESPIIPSTIAYISDEKCYIGIAAQRCSNCIYWLKHLLHESCKIDDSGDTPIQDLVRMVRNGLPQRQRDNPYILVADFLRVLLHHIRAELECILNLKNLPRVYTFTVPATWSEHTRMMMKKAIQLAGFEHRNATVCFTTEAEAVAVYAATERGINMRLFSELYDGLIVCDCGASTIDLTAFLVDQPPPSFGYQRLTAYTSQALGGVQLQSQIYDKLQNCQMMTRSRSRVAFIDSPFSEWALKTFPAGPASVIDPNHLDLPREKIEECYKDLANKIVGYIRQQVDCAAIYVGRDVIKKLLLVGGLTQSPEISGMIQNMVETRLNIMVYLPIDVDLRVQMVSLGGTMCGLRGVANLDHKFWKNYYLACEGQNQLATIFNQNSSFNDGYKEVFMDVPRTHDGDARIMIIASNTPVSLNQVHAGLVVGTIECKTSRLRTNLTPIPLVVECQATVRFEKDHLPPERVLGLAVYHGEASDKRLVGHMRVLM